MERVFFPNGKHDNVKYSDVDFIRKDRKCTVQLAFSQPDRQDETIVPTKATRTVDTNRKPILRIYRPDESLDDKDRVDGDYGSCRVYGEHSDWMLAEKILPRSPPASPVDTAYGEKDTLRLANKIHPIRQVNDSQEGCEVGSQHSNEDIRSPLFNQLRPTAECIVDRDPHSPMFGTPRQSPRPNVDAYRQQSRQRTNSHGGRDDNFYSRRQINICDVDRQRVRKQLFGTMKECGDFQSEKQTKGILTPEVQQSTSQGLNGITTCVNPYSPCPSEKRPHLYSNLQLDPRIIGKHHHCGMPKEADDIENMYYTRPVKRSHDDYDCSHKECFSTPVKQMRVDLDRNNQLNYLRKLKSDVKYLNNKLNCTEPEMRPQNCSCVLMEEHFFELAEEAYRSIRRQSSSPEGFEQFKKELIETNKMLQESMLVMRDMQEFCEHRSRKVNG